jgi:hypothetical protein
MDQKWKLANLMKIFYYTIMFSKSDFQRTFKINLSQIHIIIHDCCWKKVNQCSGSSYPDHFKLVLDEPLGSSEKVGLIEDSEVYSSFKAIEQIQPINLDSEILKKDKFEDNYRFYVNGEKIKNRNREEDI